MECEKWSELAKKIHIESFENQDVSVVNNSSLEMIGKGRQGAVFKIDEKLCMKVYGEVDDCDREHYAMSLGEHTSLLPKVHCKGENFIVMDMVYGVDLREYLQSQPLTKKLSQQLIQMLITFKEIGYERIDHHKRQIYLQDDGSLKVIDVGRTVWRNRTYPYPRKLLRSLGVENRSIFIQHVKEIAPHLYDEWEYYMKMEEVSKQLYGVLESKTKVDKKRLKKDVNKLLTMKDTNLDYEGLVGLIHKVVKEQKERELIKQGFMNGEEQVKEHEQEQEPQSNVGKSVKIVYDKNSKNEVWRPKKKKEKKKK